MYICMYLISSTSYTLRSSYVKLFSDHTIAYRKADTMTAVSNLHNLIIKKSNNNLVILQGFFADTIGMLCITIKFQPLIDVHKLT